jgi:predicted DNA-binding transcriptional regulator AlpA
MIVKTIKLIVRVAVGDIRPLATDDEFCAFAGLSKQQSAQLRYLGTSPRFIRVTGRQIRYAWSDIEAWCEAQTCSRSDQRGGIKSDPAHRVADLRPSSSATTAKKHPPSP